MRAITMLRRVGQALSIRAMVCAAALLLANSLAHAQADPKLELAGKVAQLQKGPEMDRLLQQLALASSQPLVSNWGPRVQGLPESKKKLVSEGLNAELQKFKHDALKVFTARADKIASDSLTPAYAEKFTQDELKQLTALLDSPVYKKYQSLAPELGSVFVQNLIDATKAQLQARAKVFDDAAAKLLGVDIAAPASGTSQKPPSKK